MTPRESNLMHSASYNAVKPQPKHQPLFHHRDAEFTWFDKLTMIGILHKPSILRSVEGCVLGASAVNSFRKRYNQNSHRKFAKAAKTAYLVPSQPCSDRSMVTPSGPLNLTSTLPRLAISSVPG